MGFAKAVHTVVTDFRYADLVRSATKTGFVLEYLVRGTLLSGTTLILVVGEMSGERIAATRENFDSSSAAERLAELRKQHA